jgi:tetratricopeptide (TPR) repeat protein
MCHIQKGLVAFIFLLSILLPLITTPALASETIVYPLGDAIIDAINKGDEPAEAALLMLTNELKWYEENMHRLKPDVQSKVQQVRLKIARNSTQKAARRTGDPASMFGSTGSWSPGRDMDMVYFGKKSEKAKKAIMTAFDEEAASIINEGMKNDKILVALQKKGIPIPRPDDISSKSMCFGMFDLPDFGYGRLDAAYEQAFQKAIASKKNKEDADAILRTLYRELEESMASNFEAHIATTWSGDFYRGASGQQWFKENYLQNPNKLRFMEIDPVSGEVVLRTKALNNVAEEVVKRSGFADFAKKTGYKPQFAKIASEYGMFWEHQHGGTADTAKYYYRMWDALDADILSDMSGEEVMLAMLSRKIAANPKATGTILENAGVSAEELNDKLPRIMAKWTERQLLRETDDLVRELTLIRFSPKSGSLVEQVNALKSAGRIKLDAMEIVSGLEKIKKVKPELAEKLLYSLESKFAGTDAGQIILKYIKIQLKLLADEGGELTARVLAMLRQMGRISEEQYQAALKAKVPDDMPDGVAAQIKKVRSEVMMIASAKMNTIDDSDDILDVLLAAWKKAHPDASISGKTPQLLEFIDEITAGSEGNLRKAGWAAEELRLPMAVKKKLQFSPDKVKSLSERLSARLAKNGLNVRQIQEQVYALMFNPAYTKFGDPSISVGAFDAVMGAAAAIFQTYTILNGPAMSEADEGLALGNAWVTSIPVVGDFAQGIITGSEGYWEGDKKKMADAGLWVAIGITGFVPGGQIPAIIGSLMLAMKPVAEGIYDARQAQNLVQAWIESGKWSTGKPPQLEGIYDRNGLLHRLTYDDILGTKGEVKYDSTRIKSIPFGEFTIAQSVRDYANRYVMAGNKNIDMLRENLKTMFPDLGDNVLNDLAYAERKIREKNSKLGMMFFKAYERQVKSGYLQTIAHLKKWAEDERRVTKDYEGEVKRLRSELAALEKELKNASLVKHADDTVNSYTKIATNLFEQESLPLSRVRIYENYIATYKQIKSKLQGTAKLFAEASSRFVPSSWFLTGYPTFDRDITDRLVTLMSAERIRAADQVVQLLKDLNQNETRLDLQNECHKKAFDIIAPKRYKIAFTQHLSEYYRGLTGESSKWADSYEAAKASYESTRDSILKTMAPPLAVMDNAYINAFTTFFFSMGFAIAPSDADQYRQVADGYEAQMMALREQDKSDRMAGTESEAGKALQLCLKMGMEIEIRLSSPTPEAGAEVEATVKLAKGTKPKETFWAWEAKGGLTAKQRFGEKTTVKTDSEGELIVRLMDDRYTNKSIAETKIKITPKLPMLRLTIRGPQEGEINKSLSFSAESTSDTAIPKDIRYEWSIDGQPAEQGPSLTRSFSQAKPIGIRIDAYRLVNGRRVILGSARQTVSISDITTKKDEAAEKKKEKEKLEKEKAEKERIEREKTERERQEREKKTKEPPVCKYQYSEWGECSRETKKQTRSVIGTEPDDCVEKDKPALEQGCTPPPTEAERRKNLLDCICYESHGTCSLPYRAQEGLYHPEAVGCNPLTPPAHCKAGPPCLGCSHRGFMNVTGKAIEACFQGSGIPYNTKEIENIKALNRKHVSPLKVTLSPDGRPIKPKHGEILNITANVEGGIPEYKINWSGQGSSKDNTFTFIDSRKPGTYNVSVTVNDSDGNSATASTTILVEDIKISISGLKDTVYYSSSLTLSANIAGSATPVKQGTPPTIPGTKASTTGSKSDESECTPGATCIWACHTTFCKCICPPQPYKIQYMCSPEDVAKKRRLCKDHGKPCGTCPPKKTPEPQKDTPKEESKQEEIGSITVLWQSSPNLPFSPQQGASTNVTFDRMGKVRIWAVAQRETGKGVYETVGESEQKEVAVIAPKFKVTLAPERGGVGQEVRATVSSDPPIPANMVNYVWLSPASRMPYEKNESVIGFTPKDTKPIELKASARVPTIGETISDDIQATFTAQQYTVKATVLGIPETKRPKIWKPGVGHVTLDSSTYAADEHVRLKADIEGYPDTSEVRWNWTANEGTTITSPASREPSAYRHETGTATLTVTAKDKNNIELGRAAASFSVTVSQEMIKQSAKKAEAADKLAKAKAVIPQGKLDEAIGFADEAVKADPQNTEAKSLLSKWKSERDLVKKHTEGAKKLINESKLTEAEKDLNEAKKLHPKYPPVMETEKILNEAKKKAENLKKAVAEKLNQAKSLVAQGKLDDGIGLADEASKLDPKNTEAPDLSKKWKSEKEQVTKQLEKTTRLMGESKFADAQKELIIAKNLHGRYKPVTDMEQKLANDWKGFNDKVRESFNVIDTASQKKEFRKSLELSKSMRASMKLDPFNEKELKRREDFALQHVTNHANLAKQGAELEKQGKLKEALDKYIGARNIMPDPQVEARIKDIQVKLNAQQQKAQQAAQIRAQGEALQKQNRMPEAIAKYKEYMQYVPNDTAMAKHITDLEASQRAQQQKAQYAAQLRAQGESYQKQNKIPEAIAKYKEYMTYVPNDTAMANHIGDLEKKMAADQQKAQYAVQLRAQGEALQKQNRMPEAIAKYKEYMQYVPNDTAMAKHITDLEASQRAQQQKAQYAAQLRALGESYQKQNKIPEAIAKYKEYMTYVPNDTAMANHIRTLESGMAYSIDTGRTGRSYTSRPIETPAQGQITGIWGGVWRSDPGPEKELLSFNISTNGNRLTGSWKVSAPYNASSGTQKTDTFAGSLEGTVSGSRATGSFRESSDPRHTGVFDCTMATGNSQFTCSLRPTDGQEIRTYTLRRIR